MNCSISGEVPEEPVVSKASGLLFEKRLIESHISMGKKKKVETVDLSCADVDLNCFIHQNSIFFDKLVELVPAKFYLPVDDDKKPWFQGLSKAQKNSAKKKSRENIKKAKRDRLDPEKSPATTLELLGKTLEMKKNNEPDENQTEIIANSGLGDETRSVTYEELMQKLRRKIENLRGGRNEGTSYGRKREKREKHFEELKRKREDEDGSAESISVSLKEVEKKVDEAANELTFGYVKLGTEEDNERKMKKQKLSKFQKLEKAKMLEESKEDPEKGEIVSKKHSWSAATSRAAGIKVYDDTKLLKKSIHKEEKKHQKNVGKWKERVQTTEKMKSEKQKTRSKNIADRINEKKNRRIAKREKKLMRPGFEGRKEGFIN